nr:radical SAM protein [Nanoarchaeota archaeon]
MKVALINPNWKENRNSEATYNRKWFPLSLAYTASLLRKNKIKPVLIDAHATNMSIKEIRRKIKGCDKIFITTSPYDKWQCPDRNIKPALKVFEALKDKECYVVGQHVTARPKEILKFTDAKAGVIGSPEFSILDICKNKGLSKINNLVFLRANKLIRTKRTEIDVNNLPIPAYDLVDPRNYEFEIFGKKFGIIEATRGCPYNCSFCYNKEIFGRYTEINLKKIIKSLKALKKAGFQTANFMDLNFLTNKKMVKKLCQEMIRHKLNLKWCCQTRIDNLDEETARLMKQAGCELMLIGIESASQRIQKKTKKNVSLMKTKEKMKLLKKNDIESAYFFLLGLGETRQEIEETKRFIKETKPNYISVHHVVDFSTLKDRKIPLREKLYKIELLMMNLYNLRLKDITKSPFKKLKIFLNALK